MKTKRFLPKVLSSVMAAMILLSTVGAASYSAGAESAAPKAEKTASASDGAAEKKTTSEKNKKTETVYVIAQADGTPKKVIVSNWLQNSSGADKLSDKSNLKDIKNVKGDEKFSLDENGMYEWEADGNDIYYQGTSDEQLPVGVSLSFELNGAKISPEALAGKSGKVTLRFDYTNRQSEKVKIDGKTEEIYVPFLVMTGMLLDDAKFTNVQISNGKVINDGTHTYVAGFAFPGLQKSLGIDSKDFEIPDSVEVTADVTDFELATTLTLATDDFFSDLDTDELDSKLDELDGKLKELSDAAEKLVDGSSQLYKGIGTLLDKSGDLVSGVDELYSGAEKLKNGTASLSSGAGTLYSGAKSLDSGAVSLSNGAAAVDGGAGSLSSGAGSLSSGIETLQGYVASLSGGLQTINSNSAQLCGGAKQVFTTLLSTADTQIAAAGLSAEPLTIENYSTTLTALISFLSDENAQKIAYSKALETVTATVNSQREVISSAVENTVRKQVTAAVLSAAGYSMTADEYDAAVAAGQIPEEVQASVSAAVSAQMTSMQSVIESKTDEQIQALIDENMSSEEVTAQIAEGAAQAAAGRTALENLKAQLDSYNKFYQGIISYTAGVNQASEGAKQLLSGSDTLKSGADSLSAGAGELKNGTSSLSSGAKELKSGTAQLKSGAKELSDGAKTVDDGMGSLFSGVSTLKSGCATLVSGVNELYDGSMTLSKGMKTFKEEGIDAITEAYNGDVKSLTNRLKALKKAADNYRSFSGAADDTESSVSFLFKTEGIEE